MSITHAQERLYFEARAHGLNQTLAARMGGFSLSTAKRLETKHPDGGAYRLAARNAQAMPDPLRPKDLSDDAKKALSDFGYFQRRYLGRIPIPWQVEAAHRIVALLETEDKEFVVVNCPPGVGKSTTFTHDLVGWLICRNRSIRILVGSATSKLAGQYVARVRRTLETVIPVVADDQDRENGTAVDAETTVSADFGRFKPIDHETWTKEAFLVEQYDGVSITEKEPTVTGVGRDQEFIGGRYDFCIWDDLVTSNRLRSDEMVEKDRDWWDTYAERRLEPRGLLVLQGQRMGAGDLYHYCLEMEVPEEADEDEDDDEPIGVASRSEEGVARKYHHIVFKAHYPEKCRGRETHRRGAPPYPEGCLLYPERLTWRELRPIMHNNPSRFAVVYQQEDVAENDVLVPRIWVDGNGKEFPGCWDKDRARLGVPRGLTGTFWSVMSCDPSPSRFWGIQWWLVHPDSEQRFLMDLERRAMEADDFLDWNQNAGAFTGLLEEWWQTSRDLGVPITHVIVEINAAQRFLLQYDHVRRWMARTGVEIIPHACVDTETEVLSQRGWLRSHEVAIGDLILTLNMGTGRSEWRSVDLVYRGQHDGKMGVLANANLDFVATPDHRWPVHDFDRRSSGLEFRETHELNKRHVIPLARALAPEQEPMALRYSDDFVELVGWAATEGHFRFRESKKHPGATIDYGVSIGQSNRANPEKVARIRALLDRMGARYHESRNRATDVQVFTITGAVARQLREAMGSKKDIPLGLILSLNAAQREILLDAMVAGDGWRQGPKTTSYSSNGEPLIEAFEMLCALQGSPTYRSVRHAPRVRTARRERTADHYVVRRKAYANSFLANADRVEWEEFSGEIWCPRTVNGTFYARRNGKTYFTGNTHRNKSDPEFGIQTIRPHWRFGRVRLPGKEDGRLQSLKLVDEVTQRVRTDDELMAHWFVEWQYPLLYQPDAAGEIDAWRPSWMQEAVSA